MKSIYKIILFAALLAGTSVFAQQDPNYTFYRYNMNLINPAFAGADETTRLGANVRSQWANIEGAPETQSLVFGIPMGKNVGLGASIINDKTFIERQTSLAIDFSYKLKLNDTHDIYFGLKAGFNSYDANTQGLVTYGIQQDPNLMNIDGRFNPNVGAGAYLKSDSYFISFSIPRVLTPDRLEQNDGLARLGMDRVHMYLAGGYDFPVGGSVLLRSTALFRYVNASPLSMDLTALLDFNEKFGFGAAYRLNESLSGLFTFSALGFLEIGYAYEMAFERPVKNIDNGTHEIMLNLKL